jgi:hypothetical protein
MKFTESYHYYTTTLSAPSKLKYESGVKYSGSEQEDIIVLG